MTAAVRLGLIAGPVLATPRFLASVHYEACRAWLDVARKARDVDDYVRALLEARRCRARARAARR